MFKRKKMILFLIFIFVSLVLAGCSSGGSSGGSSENIEDLKQTGIIEGRVTYKSSVDYISQSKDQEKDLSIKVVPINDSHALNTFDGLSNVEIYVENNDKIVKTDENGYFQITDLEPGNKELIFTHQNFKSFTKTVEVLANKTTQVTAANFPLIYYLSVAIDDYYGTENDLSASINSANLFNDHFYSNNKFISAITWMYDNHANKENIKSKIEEIGNSMSSNDYFVFYYSGHGYKDQEKEYLCNYVDKPIKDTYLEDWISDDDLEIWYNSYIPGNNITTILDSCHSGGFITSAKGLNNESSPKEFDSQITSLQSFAKEINKAGYTVITAANHDEFGYEIITEAGKWESLLTKYIVEAVASPNHLGDMDNNRNITAKELFDYIEPKIVDYSTEKYENGNFENIVHPQIWLGNVDPILFRY